MTRPNLVATLFAVLTILAAYAFLPPPLHHP
jgi:hypothetical protein